MSIIVLPADGTIHNVESEKPYAPSTVAALLGPGDPIAAAIGLLRPRTVIDPALHAAGPWAVRFAAFPHVKVGGIMRGECRLTMDGHEPVLLHEGDFFLLTDPPSYVLAGSPTAEPQAAEPLWATAADGTVRIGPDVADSAYVCGGHFRFDEANAVILTGVLPRLVLVRAGDPRISQISHVTELLRAEVANSAAGRSLVLDHLVQILLVHVLRAHAERTDHPTGWLAALNDNPIGAALRAMHADVAHHWTLRELAGIGHMSRSAFAASFKKQVGTAPLEYLIAWRMSLARDALRRNTCTISQIAAATGYESESAFSTAFRRVAGSPPRQFRAAAHPDLHG